MKLVMFTYKTLKYLIYSLFVLLSLLLLLLFLAIFTHHGNSLVFDAINEFEPRLTINLREGTVVDKPTYNVIRWQDDKTLIELNELSYQFDWHCLLQSVCIDSLQLSSAKINIPGSEQVADEEQNGEPFKLTFPLPITVKQLQLNDLDLNIVDIIIQLKQLQLTASAQDNDLSLDSDISGLLVQLPPSKQVAQQNTTQSQPTIDKTAMAAILNDDSLPSVTLPFDLFINQLKLENFQLLQGQQHLFKVNSLQTKFDFQDTHIHIDRFDLDIPETNLSLAGKINLAKRYPMDINAELDIKEISQLQPANLLLGQKIKLTTAGDLSALHSQIVLSNKINGQIDNKVNLYAADLPFDLKVNWRDLYWPLTGQSMFNSSQGQLLSSGKLSDYALQLKADYQLDKLPSGNIDLNSRGDLHSLNIQHLTMDTLKGQLFVDGKLDWQPSLQWVGQLRFKDIQLDELNPSYPKDLNGSVKHSFAIKQKQQQSLWFFEIDDLGLDALVLDYPLTVQGRLSGEQNSDINIKQLSITNADNLIQVSGQLSEQNNLDIKLDIKELNTLIDGADGQIQGEVKVTGELKQANIQADLSSFNLSYLNNYIKQASIKSDILLTELPTINLDAKIQQLAVNKQRIDNLNIAIKPQQSEKNTQQHRINLELDSNIANSKLQAFFTQQSTQWQAGLKQGWIKTVQGIWLLNKPFTAAIDESKHLNISAHCWRATDQQQQKNGNICFDKVYAGDNGDIKITVNDFVISTLAPFIPNTLSVQGAIDANLKLFWKNRAKPNIDFTLTGKDLAADIKLDDKQQQPHHYPVERFAIQLSSNQKQADFNVELDSQGLINSKLSGIITPYQQQPKIDADLHLQVPDFSAFTSLINGIDTIKGQLQSSIKIGGRLKQPNIDGKVYIVDTELKAQGVPVQISDLNSTIEFDQYSATVEGYFFTNEQKKQNKPQENRFTKGFKLLKETAVNTVNIPQRLAQNSLDKQQRSTQGRADINGTFNWQSKLSGDLHFKADQMLIQDYGKIELYISPDIHLIFDQIISLTGDINVDKGNITIQELPEGAVTVSKDVVVVDAESKKDSSDIPIEIGIKVGLGDQLRVKALGLDSYINGDLKINKKRLKELTVNGELTFSDGSYRAFAQQLVLQDSRIIFRGTPDEPYLSIEAIRDPRTIEDGVTAGVRVTGTPDQLTLTIFSDPSMSQQNALSYIMRGHSIENSSDENNSQIAALLIDMSSSRTDGVMSNIGSKIGIDDLKLASTGHGDEQSVGVKGTIAPGVELSYGVGVFDSFTILAIRYELFKRFYIEASSGLYQAVDAYYEWDWD